MSGRVKNKIVIADDEAQLEQKTAAAQRTPVQVDIEDYTAGGTLQIQDDVVTVGPYVPLPPPSEVPMTVPDPIAALNEKRAEIHEGQRAAPAPRVPDIFPAAGLTRYESRIRIVEAWQYAGNLAQAPSYVDRSWAAWGEWDEERKLEPGPALRVPTHGATPEKLARVGDYVVRQEVTLALDVPPDVQLEVWRKDDFEKFFLPSKPEPPEEKSLEQNG